MTKTGICNESRSKTDFEVSVQYRGDHGIEKETLGRFDDRRQADELLKQHLGKLHRGKMAVYQIIPRELVEKALTFPTHLNKTQLTNRGWTSALIKRFLGAPDIVQKHKRLRAKWEEHLYAGSRVEEVEASAEFICELEKSEFRRERGRETAERLKRELLEKLATMEVEIVKLEESELLERAINHFNRRRWHKTDDYDVFEPVASVDSDSGFLERITVNYIRHNLTSYDRLLREQAGKIGVRETGPVIKRTIFNRIAEAYPHLREECERQLAARVEECSTPLVNAV
jgi:hypothetical protein